MLKIDREHCTGCGACIQKCPRNCISFENGELGHVFPVVNSSECIDCGLCNLVCPIEKSVQLPEKQKFYAVINNDLNLLKKSTSGGFFSVVAEYVLNQNGVVYGCAFEDGFQAMHIRVTKWEDLQKLRGSKYLQSDTKNTFAQTQKDLESGNLVLYTGTPCQIAGLYGFLGKTYNNLITADLICHGVGSQSFFDRYMEFLNKKKGKIEELHFRSKEFSGWSCGSGLVVLKDKKNNREIRQPYYDYNNYYYGYFLQGAISRESCYSCKYANVNRSGDFTMGDFWGVESLDLPIDTQNGCSLVLVNTKRGAQVFDTIKNKLTVIQVTKEQAIRQNHQLVHPAKCTLFRNYLVEQFKTMSGQQMDEAFRKNNKMRILKLRIKAMVPYNVKRIIRKMRR